MANETAIHRWDGERAAGEPPPIEPDLARDGMAEMLEVFVPLMRRRPAVEATGETYHFHCTDGDGEWIVRFGADGVDVQAEHAKGDVAVRGPASDLFLWLWNRLPDDRVEALGDAALLGRWRQLIPPI